MRLRSWLTSDWLTVRVQIALGAIFVAASLPKIVDPPAFAQMIYNYRLMPGWTLNGLALVMPWVEMLAGLALIFGIWRRSAATMIGAMLVAFIIAIGINLARGHAVNCGCFDTSGTVSNPAQLFDEMRWVVIRDVGMLLMVGQILFASRRQAVSVVRSSAADLPQPTPSER